MRYTWRIDETDLIVVRTDGGDEWIPDAKGSGASLAEAVDTKWRDMVMPYAATCGIPVRSVTCQITQESAGNPRAFRQEPAPTFWTGIGLLQITHPGVKNGHTDDQLYDPDTNIRIGTFHIAGLALKYKTEDGRFDWPRVFAAYNAGSARPDPKNPWNLFCTNGHVNAEVYYYNHLRLLELDEARKLALNIVADFDPAEMLDLRPHAEVRDPQE